MTDAQEDPPIRRRPRREKTVDPLSKNMREAADRLGMGITSFWALTKKHPLYAPDSMVGADPRWSEDLLELIEFARRVTPQGVRELTDEEALRARRGMTGKRRYEYLKMAEDYV